MARPRETHSAEEIRDEVQRRIDRRLQEMGDGYTVGIHLPMRLAEPDERGCNWVMQSYTGDRGLFNFVGSAVLEVKDIWNMP